MKKIFLGIIIGVLLSTATYAFADDIQKLIADKASFPILVNGKELDTSQKPAVVIDGSTYLPLKSLGTALNVPVNWNNNLRRVEVGSTPQTTAQSSTTQPASNIDFKIVSSRFVRSNEIRSVQPFDGFRFKLVDVQITNNGDKTITFKPSDIKVNYKISDDDKNNPNIINFAPIGTIASSKMKNNIVSGEDIDSSKFTGMFKDTEIKFGDIAPGQTVGGTIIYSELIANTDWFEVSFKGTTVRSE